MSKNVKEIKIIDEGVIVIKEKSVIVKFKNGSVNGYEVLEQLIRAGCRNLRKGTSGRFDFFIKKFIIYEMDFDVPIKPALLNTNFESFRGVKKKIPYSELIRYIDLITAGCDIKNYFKFSDVEFRNRDLAIKCEGSLLKVHTFNSLSVTHYTDKITVKSLCEDSLLAIWTVFDKISIMEEEFEVSKYTIDLSFDKFNFPVTSLTNFQILSIIASHCPLEIELIIKSDCVDFNELRAYITYIETSDTYLGTYFNVIVDNARERAEK